MIFSELSHLPIKRLTETAKMPTRGYDSDAGFDIYSDEDCFIELGTTKVISTGIALKIADKHYGQIASRSSISSKGVEVGGGVIDSAYTGELKVILHNLTNNSELRTVTKTQHSHYEYTSIQNTYEELVRGIWIKKGDKIAQLIIKPILTPTIYEVKELPTTDRANNGFGSTDRR